MSDMPYNLVGVSLQTKYTTKDGPRGPSQTVDKLDVNSLFF